MIYRIDLLLYGNCCIISPSLTIVIKIDNIMYKRIIFSELLAQLATACYVDAYSLLRLVDYQ